MSLYVGKKYEGSPDGHMLQSNREMREVFRAYFRHHFGGCPV